MAVKRQGFLEVQDAACARLASGDLPRLLVITGEEPFLKERLLEALQDGSPGELEVFAMRPDEADGAAGQRLLDLWTTPTLFGGGRVILARQADALFKGTRAATFAEVLARGETAHQLVVTLAALDGRSKLAKVLKGDDGLVALPPLRDLPPPWQDRAGPGDVELNHWIRAEGRRRKLQISLETAAALTRRVGNEPARLVHQLEQLGALVGARIGIDDVRAHVQPTSARLLSLFEDALYRGDAAEALTLLDRMGTDGVYDHTMRLVSGPEASDTLLRGVASNLARLVRAHEDLGEPLLTALRQPPWKRSQSQTAELNRVLGSGGRRVWMERDLRRTGLRAARGGLHLAVGGLRRLRDGDGLNMHIMTVRLARALGGAA